MNLLQEKVVIITGASSGIGRATAELFFQHRANLILVARNGDRLGELAHGLSDSSVTTIACPGDVCDASVHARAVELAIAHFGRLDAAFNNAGTVGTTAPLAELTRKDWSLVVETNLTSAFLAAKHQVPAMLRNGGGSMVFSGSFVGMSTGLPGMGAYAAAKAGLTGFVKALTADYAHLGLRANTLLPGGTDTPMAGDEAAKQWAASLHPVGRIATPHEIAQAALFLTSDMSSFVYGSNLWADGGNSATKVYLGA